MEKITEQKEVYKCGYCEKTFTFETQHDEERCRVDTENAKQEMTERKARIEEAEEKVIDEAKKNEVFVYAVMNEKGLGVNHRFVCSMVDDLIHEHAYELEHWYYCDWEWREIRRKCVEAVQKARDNGSEG